MEPLRALLPLIVVVYAMTAPQQPSRTAAKSPIEEQLAAIVRDFRGVMGVVAIDLESGNVLEFSRRQRDGLVS